MSTTRGVRRMLAVTAGVLLAVAVSLAAGPGAAAAGPGVAAAGADTRCTELRVPTRAVVGGIVAGRLCRPSTPTTTVVVLVPGGTYDRTYWDFPYRPATYDVRRALGDAGYATMTLDPLGVGASTRPPSALITIGTQATGVHDVITTLRAGAGGGPGFRRVVLGGHSVGSFDSIAEAARYHDEDALLLTGFSHRIDPVDSAGLLASVHPAGLDPVTAAKGYTIADPGYVTTGRTSRARYFHAPRVEPAVIDTDDATKDAVAAGSLGDGLAFETFLPTTARITGPVMIANGGRDGLFCTDATCATSATFRAAEQPGYPRASCLTAHVLPGSGHDVNLDPETARYQRAVIGWLGQLPATWDGGPCPAATR